MSKHLSILLTRASLFILRSGKIDSEQEFQNKTFREAIDNHIKVVLLHVVVFTEHSILHFLDNVHLLKYYPVKVPQNSFNSVKCLNKTGMQVSKFSFALDK